jgi:hypothetical protein
MTDQLRSYPAAKAEIPELINVKHVSSKPVPGLTTALKTATNLHVNASDACVVFVIPKALKLSCRALD